MKLRHKIIKKGVCWEQSPYAKLFCQVCNSKTIDIELETDTEDPGLKIIARCSCGAVSESEMVEEQAT